MSYLRARHSRHDFAAGTKEREHGTGGALKTVGTDGTRIFGKPFVTAGWIVVAVAVIVFAVEIALLSMVLQL